MASRFWPLLALTSHVHDGPNVSVVLTGVSATGALGSLGVSHDQPLSGVQGVGGLGLVLSGIDAQEALTGVEAVGQLGTLTPSTSVPLGGLQGIGSLGTLTAQGGSGGGGGGGTGFRQPLFFQNILDAGSNVTDPLYTCWLSNGSDGNVDDGTAGAALLRVCPIPAPGVFSDFVMDIGQAPGAGASWTFILQFVQSATLSYTDPLETYPLLASLTVTIAEGATRSAVDTSEVEITAAQVAAGAMMVLKAIPSGPPATMDEWRGVVNWSPADGTSMLYGGHMGSTSGAFGTRYQGPFFPSTGFKTVRAEAVNIMSSGGVIKDMYVREDNYYVTASNRLQAGQGVDVYLSKSTDQGATWVRQDGTGGTVDTRVSVYGPGSPCWAFREDVNLPFAPDDLIMLEWVAGPSGGGTTRQWAFAMTVVPTVAGEFMIGSTHNNASTSSGNTRYQSLINRQDSELFSSETYSRRLLIGTESISLSKYYIWQSAAAGAGATRTWTLRQTIGGVLTDTLLAVTIAGATEVQDHAEVDGLPMVEGEEATIKMVTANSPATTRVAWSLVVGVDVVIVIPPIPTGCPDPLTVLPTDGVACARTIGPQAV